MVRVRLTERQWSRLLTAWLLALTVSTATHFFSPHCSRSENIVVNKAEGRLTPCNNTSAHPTADTPCQGVVEVLLDGPLHPTDNRLLEWVKQGGGSRVFPPSTLPYNITIDNIGGWRGTGVWKFYVKVVERYFGKKEGGFFVEAGALDGVLLSTTLTLEQNQAWTGLLVEPRPDMFHQLLNTHRKAYAARFCLSEKPYPHKERVSNF
nr:uncharacterized protein LOC128689926 [Cherax quadricarinatus]